MDPNVALNRIRYIRHELDGKIPARYRIELMEEFMELFAALDEWLSKGGFKPSAWTSITASMPPRYIIDKEGTE